MPSQVIGPKPPAPKCKSSPYSPHSSLQRNRCAKELRQSNLCSHESKSQAKVCSLVKPKKHTDASRAISQNTQGQSKRQRSHVKPAMLLKLNHTTHHSARGFHTGTGKAHKYTQKRLHSLHLPNNTRRHVLPPPPLSPQGLSQPFNQWLNCSCMWLICPVSSLSSSSTTTPPPAPAPPRWGRLTGSKAPPRPPPADAAPTPRS